MSRFLCQTCGIAFAVPESVLDRYPGWKPRYCREHSPKKGVAGQRTRQPRGRRPASAPPGGPPSHENLTLAEVLAKHQGGPASGVFTDGSSVPNPGPGGWGVVWVEAGEIRSQRHGHHPKTTNNRMELTALIEAFRLLPDEAETVVRTDSRLCVDTIEKWAPAWERKGWTKKGGEIKNVALVQELLAQRRAHPRCTLEWIAAHTGNRWNEYADSLSLAWLREEL
jgi:ribonuclease HI